MVNKPTILVKIYLIRLTFTKIGLYYKKTFIVLSPHLILALFVDKFVFTKK